jgi:transposase
MKQFIGCDTHLKYSVFRILSEDGVMGPAMRIEHGGGEMERFLAQLPAGSPVALESTGSYGWLVRAIEEAGLEPHLGHALEVKKRIGGTHKTDTVDARGLALLLRNGTFPEVWIPPAGVRDLRGMVRSRLALRRHQNSFKCRIHAVLSHYGVKQWVEDEEDVIVRDWFAAKSREQLMKAIEALPAATREATRQEYLVAEDLERHVRSLELAIRARVGQLGWLKLLKSLPGVGDILGPTIWLEVGDVRRFPDAQHLAGYAGLVPRTHSSGGKTWRGPTSKSCNHYLKWAFVEAANVIAAQHHKMQRKHPHVVGLYSRVKATTKLSGKAKVAVARHLAESTWWILTKKQFYREPTSAQVTSSNNG